MSGEAWFWIGCVVLIILFAGEPDLHDAIVKSLMPR
jgi:hypothetical protein